MYQRSWVPLLTGRGPAKAGPHVLFALAVIAAGRPAVATGVYATCADVRPILTALADVLPAELKAGSESAWTTWAVKHDKEVRARLERGDLDTIVNWLLLGTTFTSRPRAILESSATDVVQLPAAVASDRPDDGDHVVWYRRSPSF